MHVHVRTCIDLCTKLMPVYVSMSTHGLFMSFMYITHARTAIVYDVRVCKLAAAYACKMCGTQRPPLSPGAGGGRPRLRPDQTQAKWPDASPRKLASKVAMQANTKSWKTVLEDKHDNHDSQDPRPDPSEWVMMMQRPRAPSPGLYTYLGADSYTCFYTCL